MSPRAVDHEEPYRLYTVTGGRSHLGDPGFDLIALIVSERDPAPGMQSEHARILTMCRHPMVVAEISADLRLPVSVTRILLRDLRDAGSISVREPPAVPRAQPPDQETLRQVLVALRRL